MADHRKVATFSFADTGLYSKETAFFTPDPPKHLLSLLNSRVLWFMLSQLAQPLRLRVGLWQYQAKKQFVERLSIPDLTAQQESDLAATAEETINLARRRYKLHEDFQQTMVNKFEGGEINMRVALYRWWDFEDEKALSEELRRQFKREIPLGKRSEWRGFLAEQQSAHRTLTDSIIAQETRLNAIVYDAFDLTPDERALIETTTKYH